MSEGELKEGQISPCAHCGKPGAWVSPAGIYEQGADHWHPRCFAIAVGTGFTQEARVKFSQQQAVGYVAAMIDSCGDIREPSKANVPPTITHHSGEIILRLRHALDVLGIKHSVKIHVPKPGLRPEIVVSLLRPDELFAKLRKVPVQVKGRDERIKGWHDKIEQREKERLAKWKAKGFKGTPPKLRSGNPGWPQKPFK